MVRVAVFTPGSISASGIRTALKNSRDIELSGIFSTLDEAEAHIRKEAPNVLLMELTPAIDLNEVRKMVSARRETAIVLWFDSVSEPFLHQGLAAGARGIINRNSSIESHAECLIKVAQGLVWVEQTAKSHMSASKTVRLAPRERHLMGLVAQGLSNKEIAWSLDIRPNTVKMYLTHLYSKLRVNDRLELALVALKNTQMNENSFRVLPHAPNGEKVAPLYMPPFLCVKGGFEGGHGCAEEPASRNNQAAEAWLTMPC
jgi:DNA-binding NarL/FixJ family response regulator